MLILTEENLAYNLDRIPEEDVDVRYCVLDCSKQREMDFYWLPLVFLESFNAPAVVLDIGPYQAQMPLDWSILVCDDTYSDLEVMPLTQLNDRGFHAIVFNPLEHMVPQTFEVNIMVQNPNPASVVLFKKILLFIMVLNNSQKKL